MLKLQSQTLLENQVRCSSSIVSFLMYLAYYSRQFYLTIRFNWKLKFKVSPERLRPPSKPLATFAQRRATSHVFVQCSGRPLTSKIYENEIKFLCLWLELSQQKKTGKRKWKRKREPISKQKEKEKSGKRVRKIKQKTENREQKGKQDTKQKRALKKWWRTRTDR